MSHRCLPDLLESLAASSQLARVSAPVSCDLEIAEITRRVSRAGGPALLFERVCNKKHAVVTNLFGTPERLCLALGCDSLAEFVERSEHALSGQTAPSWMDRLRGKSGPPSERFAPQLVKLGACQQVIELGRDLDLEALPALRMSSESEQPALTSGLVLSYGPQGPALERMLLPVLRRPCLGIVASPFSKLQQNLNWARSQNERLPVAIVLGGPPLLSLMAEMLLPDSINPLLVAGALSGQAIPIVRGRTQPIEVPADAEMILEGLLDPRAEPEQTGAIVTPGGFLLNSTQALGLEVTALTRRANAAFPATVFGTPSGELAIVDRLVEKFLLQELQTTFPQALDLAWLPWGPRHSAMALSLRKNYPYQARDLAGWCWGHPQWKSLRTVVLVDSETDVRSPADVLSQLSTHVRGDRDVFTQLGSLDLVEYAYATGPKFGLDATSKLYPAESDVSLPPLAQVTASARDRVDNRWKEYGLGTAVPENA